MRYKKVLLITPPNSYISKDYLPPLGILYLSSYLEKNGVTVKVIDIPIEHVTKSYVTDFANHSDYDLIGITSTTVNRFGALELIKNIKKPIVLGGVHFTYTAKQTLSRYPNIIAVVRRQGEQALLEICKGTELSQIHGISFTSNDKFCETPESNICSINEIPWPSRHLVPMEKYTAVLEGEYHTRCTSIITSRGCRYNCIFCSNSSYWKGVVNYRDPIDVVNEIEYIKNKYRINGFDIWDDTFTTSKTHVMRICSEIINRKLDIKFYARVRVDTVTDQLFSTLKKAGCVAISFGVESGSERILNFIGKGIDLKQVIMVAKLCEKYKFYTKAFFIFNHPNEKYRDLIKTFKFMKLLNQKYGIKTVASHSNIVYPGTKLEKILIKTGKLDQNFDWDNYYNWKNIFCRYRDCYSLYYPNLNPFMIEILYKLYL